MYPATNEAKPKTSNHADKRDRVSGLTPNKSDACVTAKAPSVPTAIPISVIRNVLTNYDAQLQSARGSPQRHADSDLLRFGVRLCIE